MRGRSKVSDLTKKINRGEVMDASFRASALAQWNMMQ
jgi:hypothetical protein